MKKTIAILSIIAMAACSQPAEQTAEIVDSTAVAVVDTSSTIIPDTVAVDTAQ
jgi:hypothetical protein